MVKIKRSEIGVRPGSRGGVGPGSRGGDITRVGKPCAVDGCIKRSQGPKYGWKCARHFAMGTPGQSGVIPRTPRGPYKKKTSPRSTTVYPHLCGWGCGAPSLSPEQTYCFEHTQEMMKGMFTDGMFGSHLRRPSCLVPDCPREMMFATPSNAVAFGLCRPHWVQHSRKPNELVQNLSQTTPVGLCSVCHIHDVCGAGVCDLCRYSVRTSFPPTAPTVKAKSSIAHLLANTTGKAGPACGAPGPGLRREPWTTKAKSVTCAECKRTPAYVRRWKEEQL